MAPQVPVVGGPPRLLVDLWMAERQGTHKADWMSWTELDVGYQTCRASLQSKAKNNPRKQLYSLTTIILVLGCCGDTLQSWCLHLFFVQGPTAHLHSLPRNCALLLLGFVSSGPWIRKANPCGLSKLETSPSSSAKCQKHTYHISYYIQRDIEEQKYRSSCNSSRKRDWNLQKKQHET